MGHELRPSRGGLRDETSAGEPRHPVHLGASGFEQFLESLPDAVVGVTRGGTIVLANEQAQRLFGYAPEELVGLSINALVPDRFGKAHSAHREGYFRDPRTRPMGARLQLAGKRKDGTEFPAEISLSSTRTDEGVLAWAAVRDISERLEAEREREQMRRAARETQAQRLESLGQLAGGVAHDFNNLLGVIINYAGFVRDELGDRPDLAADVEQIREAAERGAALTRQLLIFGRREVTAPEILSLAEVVRAVEQLLRRALGEHIELRARHEPGLATVRADRGQLEQVLFNLAVNARDAMPGGGVLAITTRTADEAERDELPMVELVVADTGSGMSDAVQQRAMEPFFTTKPEGRGTGLGLATVYGIATQHDGRVRIESALGEGTVVRVQLPAVGQPATSTEHQRSQRPASRGETILLVEDEPSGRRIARRILERAGYRVIAVDAGAAALEVLAGEDHAVDLLLTDVIMPGMLGTELADRVVAGHRGLRVLLMSGYSDELVTRPRSHHHHPLIEKPFDATGLLTRIRGVLAGPSPGPAGTEAPT
ncbi:PAS/PAC sensor hybrid histidine kinase [Patulibacter medicamentivorans]|uniref:histidine kinase n=1 Tax=Patulibacter medicamentivorans TaxID=1097667 RepID=H0E6W8_9ACTN|nr:PAS domain S-box protein [Patulibacter medicamentivorans]EHN10571.1 PAS/PAC sensor hybrid histidine kinase [Patulibacter medicamentivorans]